MSNKIDTPILAGPIGLAETPGLLSCIRSRTVILYLAVMLAGLAAGFWPEAIHPAASQHTGSALPSLQTLAVAQVVFILLIHPLLLMRLRQHDSGGHVTAPRQRPLSLQGEVGPQGPGEGDSSLSSAATMASPQEGNSRIRALAPIPLGRYLALCSLESAVLLAVTLPFYAACGYLADAAPKDCLRVVADLACLWPLAWAAGASARHWPGATLLVLVAAAMGLPAGWYICRDFVPGSTAGTAFFWNLGPATFAWTNAASRVSDYLPAPAWAFLAWPAVAAAGFLAAISSAGRAK